jgi:hypothetical protein
LTRWSDLYEDSKDRIDAIKERLKSVQKLSTKLDERATATGFAATEVEQLQAKSLLLEMQILLLREEQKLKGDK